MNTNLKEYLTQIDKLNKEEQIEVFHYLGQHLHEDADAKEKQAYESDYEDLLQYIAEHAGKEYRRSLQEFRGIAPNLLAGQDVQEWVNQLRDEWAEREKVWRAQDDARYGIRER